MPHPELYPLPDGVQGVPTQAELDAFPRKSTWEETRKIILDCDLIKLKRNPELQLRYDNWNIELKKQYGTVERYLLEVRLPPEFAKHSRSINSRNGSCHQANGSNGIASKTMSSPEPEWVRHADINPADLLQGGKGYCLLPNDWPYTYSVPVDATHSILWTKKPIVHEALVDYDQAEWDRIKEDGISGVTGQPGVADRFTSGGQEFHEIVKTLWNPKEFECAWFVNPPRLQSVPGLSHGHIFARAKA